MSIGADIIIIGRIQGSLCLGKLFIRAVRHLDIDHLTHRIPDTHGTHHPPSILSVHLHILHAGAVVEFDSTIFDEEGKRRNIGVFCHDLLGQGNLPDSRGIDLR